MKKPAAKTATLSSIPYGRYLFWNLVTVALYLLITSQAYAGGTPMADVLCLILDWIHGNMGRGLAILGIMIVGIGALLGKASWGLALTVGVGISVTFGAATLVRSMGVTVANC